MCHHRYVPATGLIDLGLAGGIGQMVVTTDDVGDTHVMVIDHNRQHISRSAIRAQQNQIVEILVLPGDAALHLVLDDGFAFQRRFQAHHRLDAFGGI